ncbi:cyclase family protein [Paenibacillus sp. N1-5-1-14]|uniref:cyclase family protein n=1 Tax=Paenibacillus radicibacter TaxID=2972488 RepID=UPI002158E988|nr:cyclase family protein [Paenibacillus radicibacter]MCR8644233.1 cyclase family protein [Paenibacillus radicibacter]
MLDHTSIQDKRVQFDFEVDFSNGGGIQGQGFRLDIEGDHISDDALSDYIIKDLRLLMVGTVRILNKQIIQERHKRKSASTPSNGSKSKLIDLSHSIVSGMETYPDFPKPQVTDYISHEESEGRYAPGVTFHIGRVDMVANTGTAIDSPAHRFAGMADVAGLSIDSVADLEGIVIRLNGMTGRAITRQALAAYPLNGRAVLIETGMGQMWGLTAYFEKHPYLTHDAAEYLRDEGAVLVGIDSLNIDNTTDPYRPAHSILLGAGIPIVENLCNLEQLPTEGFRFSAAPMKLQGMSAFPVRAWARLTTNHE